MKTYATVTGPSGKVKLTYGIYGLKNFCKRLGCEPSILSVLPAFTGGTRLEALAEIVRSGVEQTAADKGDPINFSDYQACEILETASEAEAADAMKAFLSSIVGEEYDAWLNRLKVDADAVKQVEESEEKKSKPSQAGTKSKPKPTEKSD